MQKLLFITIAILLFTTSIFAQKKQKNIDSEERQTYVSVLLNIDSEEITNTLIRTNSIDEITSINTTTLPRNSSNLGFTFQSAKANNTYQEVSLTRLSRVKEESKTINISFFSGTPDTSVTTGNIISVWDIKTRYELGKYLLSKDSKVNFGIGLAAAPGFYYYNINPRISSFFPLFGWNANVDLTLVPIASIKLTNNLSFAVKVVPSLWTIEWNRERVDNPILTERQRVNITTESSFFDKSTVTNIQLRFKIGDSMTQKNKKGKKKKRKRRRRQ